MVFSLLDGVFMSFSSSKLLVFGLLAITLYQPSIQTIRFEDEVSKAEQQLKKLESDTQMISGLMGTASHIPGWVPNLIKRPLYWLFSVDLKTSEEEIRRYIKKSYSCLHAAFPLVYFRDNLLRCKDFCNNKPARLIVCIRELKKHKHLRNETSQTKKYKELLARMEALIQKLKKQASMLSSVAEFITLLPSYASEYQAYLLYLQQQEMINTLHQIRTDQILASMFRPKNHVYVSASSQTVVVKHYH